VETTKARSKNYYDRQIHVPKFRVGDVILLQHEIPWKKGPSWIGSYTIKETNRANVNLQL
jgi:hypothetical protein